MKFCTFTCEEADTGKSQHAACMAVNGVHCKILGRVVEKGMPCQAQKERTRRHTAKKK